MSWLGLNGSSREELGSLSDAYNSMYAPQKEEETKEEEQQELAEGLNPFKKSSPMDKAKQLDRLMKQAKDPFADTSIKKEELELLASLQDAYSMMYEKKDGSDKCGDDTYWDKEEKKCKSKKSKKSGRSTVIIGGGYGHGHGGSNGGGDGDGGDTDGGDGGDGGGDGGGGGGE